MRKIFCITLFTLILTGLIRCQTKTNTEKYYDLVEKSVSAVMNGKVQKESRVCVESAMPERYQLLKSSLLEKIAKSAKLILQKENSDFVFIYSVEDARVTYGETFTKSFLGRNYVEREVTLKGFAGMNKPADIITAGRFEFSEKDTVEYGSLKDLGNSAYPFTNPEIPTEPFFSSIWEPVIAIGVAITTVYLLFTVRSK